jgi:hypothetical protein
VVNGIVIVIDSGGSALSAMQPMIGNHPIGWRTKEAIHHESFLLLTRLRRNVTLLWSVSGMKEGQQEETPASLPGTPTAPPSHTN